MRQLATMFVAAIVAALAVTACGDTGTNPNPPTPDEGVLSVTSNVDGAVIYIDGFPSEYVTPSDLLLPRGVYTVEVEMAGMLSQPDQLEVQLQDHTVARFQLVEQTDPCDSCRADQECVNEICTCPSGKEEVDGVCTVVSSDPCEGYYQVADYYWTCYGTTFENDGDFYADVENDHCALFSRNTPRYRNDLGTDWLYHGGDTMSIKICYEEQCRRDCAGILK